MITVENKRNYSGQGVYIGRPSVLGNPFSVQQYGREQCIEKYRAWLKSEYAKHGKVYAEIQRLVEIAEQGDLVLVCWCSPEPCHGEVLKRVIEHLVARRSA
jgi:hypothetical protein